MIEYSENPFFFTLILCGAIIFMVALILLKFPPKKINSLYGYRTPNSMKSQEHWDFAQVYSAKLMLILGIILMLIAPIGFLMANLPPVLTPILIVLVLLLPVVFLFLKTEKALKEKFKA